MSLTTAQTVEVNQRTSSDPILTLVTISHDDVAIADHRMVFNPDPVTSNGLVFESRYFQWRRPNEGNVQPRGSLQAWNGDGTLGALVRSVSTPLAVKVELVLGSDLDTVLKEWPHYQWLNIQYDAITITGDLTQRDFGRELWPPLVQHQDIIPGAVW